jgi:hypothetical protein
MKKIRGFEAWIFLLACLINYLKIEIILMKLTILNWMKISRHPRNPPKKSSAWLKLLK